MRHERVAVVAASSAFILAVLLAGRVVGDERKQFSRAVEPRFTITASEDSRQWITATLPVDPNAEATVVHGPFFLTFLAPGDPIALVATGEGRNPTVIGHLTELASGRVFIPSGYYLLAKKGGAEGRIYSGFRPHELH
ncbi:MAG: hypothetical protein ACAI25_03645 [Planctomycetota bacterium]